MGGIGKHRLCSAFLAFFLIFTACRLPADPPPETTGSAVLVSTQAPPRPETPSAPGPIWSQTLFVEEDAAYFVHPATGLLMRYDLREKEGKPLWEQPVEDAFFLSASRLYVKNRADGYLYTLDTEGIFACRLFSLPFAQGLLRGETLFLLGQSPQKTLVLYQYESAQGTWSMQMLEKSRVSLGGGTAVFGGDALYYIQESEEGETVVARALDTGQKTVAYTGRGRLCSLFWREETLYVTDEGGMHAVTAEGVKDLTEDGGRLLAALADGILFGSAQRGSEAVFYVNEAGQEIAFTGGIVLAGHGARAVVARRDGGGAPRLSLVKYPEDEEQALLLGMFAALKTGGVYALAVCYDQEEMALWNLATGRAVLLRGPRTTPTAVSVQAYLSDAASGRTPSDEALANASPLQIAQLYAASLCRFDRYTLGRVTEGVLPLSYPYFAEGFKLTRQEETERRAVFAFELTEYKSAACAAFLPPSLKPERLLLRKTADGWRVLLKE